MHPAFSVIFLTTLIGVGQGLFLALYTHEVVTHFSAAEATDLSQFYGLGAFIAVGFLILGLIASFFHLGHPERAWRAAAKWRTSWLSREVIVLPAAMGLIGLYGLAHWFGYSPAFVSSASTVTLSLGLAATFATLALFICTAMIYASLKFLQEWHSPLTVINYILLGSASGFTLATALSAWMGTGQSTFFAVIAIALTVFAFIFRGASLMRNKSLRPEVAVDSGVGIHHPHIAQKAQGAMGGSFNTREFFHGKKASFVKNMKLIFLVLVFAVPLLLLGVSLTQAAFIIPVVAFITQYIGLLAERWYFFAEARHPQNMYYQSIA